uniref:Putative secreted protein n=1 Tax=Anopheles darlingi TaxID=43151 RepID=A0A2M4D4X5_ANODA
MLLLRLLLLLLVSSADRWPFSQEIFSDPGRAVVHGCFSSCWLPSFRNCSREHRQHRNNIFTHNATPELFHFPRNQSVEIEMNRLADL